MIDHTSAAIDKVSVHHVGNKTNGEDITLSKNSLDTEDVRLHGLLMRFFLSPFSNNEFYSFTFTNQDFTLNPLYSFAAKIFVSPKDFHRNSIHIAKHLFEVSNHPQIKSGDLFVALFSDMVVNDEQVNAIGIFKSEDRQSFLKLDLANSDFSLNYDDGINVDKLDKGCLIFDTDKENGFKICIVDRNNKSGEAQFWKDNFLMLRPCNDNYHQTKEFLNTTKHFVTKQLTEDFEVNRTDQIDMLNRSMKYFKTHESFDKKEFEKEVFQEPGIIKSFRRFDDELRDGNPFQQQDQFDISPDAVKRQSRVFKSVLKLDKNFHIYIHGDRDLIEQGVDKDGRKFYKIYFEKEA